MASYQIEFKRSAARDLAQISPRNAQRIWRSIEALEETPFPRQSIKLSGAEQLHRLRVGVYRVIYEVDPIEAVITIHHIRHRREAYRGL